MSHGRSLREELFRKSTNQRRGKRNQVTAKSCSERSIHKKSTAATGRHHPFAKKSQPTGVPLLLVRSVLLYSPRPRAQSNSVHMDARAEQPLGLGGRQHDGAAPYVIQRDQAVGADRLFSWLLLLLLLCKPLGHAAPRMVYGAARVPPWRRAPPLAHLYVVAVRAAGLESWPRLLLTARLGSGSKLVVVYQSVLAHSYSYDASHCQPLPVDLDIFSFVCPWSRFLLIFSNCPSRNRL